MAKKAEVKNAGYKGLYNEETADDIAKRKGLRYREDILNNMGSEELAANLFRISQTESKLKKDNIQGEERQMKLIIILVKILEKLLLKIMVQCQNVYLRLKSL